ncbi:hypothetical protein DPMN_102668 [Dreissena polymorpha]|uniref:Uncharacterized protein n=1 Tax=Dreissena polymorpha TaxID=45954 RepID=A0A9D4RAQ8_DREPO|nr:hypothetical protein DPMN_102668 [Dreissena polymorpha]
MAVTDPAEWGWTKKNTLWKVFWTNLDSIAESCKELTKCGCKTDCSGRCKCYGFGLACTGLCSCMCKN